MLLTTARLLNIRFRTSLENLKRLTIAKESKKIGIIKDRFEQSNKVLHPLGDMTNEFRATQGVNLSSFMAKTKGDNNPKIETHLIGVASFVAANDSHSKESNTGFSRNDMGGYFAH